MKDNFLSNQKLTNKSTISLLLSVPPSIQYKSRQTEIKSGPRKTKLFTPLFPGRTIRIISATYWRGCVSVHGCRTTRMLTQPELDWTCF